MPTYDYICHTCGKKFEVFQSMSAEALKECPRDQCSQDPWAHGQVERKIGAGAGLIFNGSGFYLTDYKNSAGSSTSSPSADSSTSTSSGGASGAETV